MIPPTITFIDEEAFYNCVNLNAVFISSIESWCNIEFDWSDSNPLRYAKHLYVDGNEVNEIVIPEGVTAIGDGVFSNCSELTNIVIPESVTFFGEDVFEGTPWLMEQRNRNDFVVVNDILLDYCGNDSIVSVPNGITAIAPAAFRSNSNLIKVTIPDSVNGIGRYAFAGCNSMMATVNRGSYAAQYCKTNGLRYIYPDSLDWLNN